jgi:hypothetical protein
VAGLQHSIGASAFFLLHTFSYVFDPLAALLFIIYIKLFIVCLKAISG